MNRLEIITILRNHLPIKTRRTTLDELAEALLEEFDGVRADVAVEVEDALWERDQERLRDLHRQALATGKPDLFSDELQGFWVPDRQ